MSNPYPIDPVEVDAFFQAQGVDAVVGMSCDDGDCPLARFLNEQYAGSTFYVNNETYSRSMDDVCLGVEPDAVLPLDEWAQIFVRLIDESAVACNELPVSGLDAICFLHVACGAAGVPLEG